MKNFLRQNGIWLLAIALLLSLVITLSSVLLGGSANPLANVVQAVTSPIRGGISAVLDWADGVSTYVFRYGEMQQELEEKTYEASAGGGVVTATVSGKRELKALKIDPDAVDPDDVEMLEDLIVAAVNEAMRAAEGDAASTMQKLTGGLGLPF